MTENTVDAPQPEKPSSDDASFSMEAQMLNALEIFHYENRFRESVFVIALEQEVPLSNILTDLRVLQASDIRVILFCRDTPTLEAELHEWSLRGAKFRYFRHPINKDVTKTMNNVIRRELNADVIPVIALDQVAEDDPRKPFTSRAERAKSFALQALDTAQDFSARKIFFLSSFKGLEIDGKLKSHPSEDDIRGYLQGGQTINIGREQLAFIQEQFVDRGIEIALLEGASGILFQEIFTHRGKGTLFTEDYPNVIRRGELHDVTDISLLMKPSISSGAILPVSEDDIAAADESYFLFTVNGVIVAASRLVDYRESCELAKFSTLPRFQGKGRARKLALAMVEEARLRGKKYVFALSIEPKMWEFFQDLGFEPIEREALPSRWRSEYDFKRPSRAFRLEL